MSKANVDTVRILYELFDRRDASLRALVPPEFIVDFSRRLINPLVAPRDEARAILERDLDEAWE